MVLRKGSWSAGQNASDSLRVECKCNITSRRFNVQRSTVNGMMSHDRRIGSFGPLPPSIRRHLFTFATFSPPSTLSYPLKSFYEASPPGPNYVLKASTLQLLPLLSSKLGDCPPGPTFNRTHVLLRQQSITISIHSIRYRHIYYMHIASPSLTSLHLRIGIPDTARLSLLHPFCAAPVLSPAS